MLDCVAVDLTDTRMNLVKARARMQEVLDTAYSHYSDEGFRFVNDLRHNVLSVEVMEKTKRLVLIPYSTSFTIDVTKHGSTKHNEVVVGKIGKEHIVCTLTGSQFRNVAAESKRTNASADDLPHLKIAHVHRMRVIEI